jgi:hypothetical protein
MQAASDQAGAQAKATPTGRRLEEIDRLLNPEPKKPDWRGSALILIVFLGFPPLLIWLAMHFHH